jgi:hypothetical protein
MVYSYGRFRGGAETKNVFLGRKEMWFKDTSIRMVRICHKYMYMTGQNNYYQGPVIPILSNTSPNFLKMSDRQLWTTYVSFPYPPNSTPTYINT